MRTTQQVRDAWQLACRPVWSAFTFWNGVRIDKVDARALEAWRALDAIFRAWNYRPLAGQTWGGNCRRITGGTLYSLHAHWVASDTNSLANPYGPQLVTDRPRDMVEAILAVRTVGGHLVWGWGGNYRVNKDAMHDEVVASPAELATGIDWATVRRPGGSGGRMPNRLPNIVASRPDPTGPGHWLVGGDGGVFAFAGARFCGSMGGQPLRAPIVDLVPTPSGGGYWLIGGDGGIFAFGDAHGVVPYATLAEEWGRGERAVVGASLEASTLTLTADTGDAYAFAVPGA